MRPADRLRLHTVALTLEEEEAVLAMMVAGGLSTISAVVRVALANQARLMNVKVPARVFTLRKAG